MNKVNTILTNVILRGKIYIPRTYINFVAYYLVPATLIVLYASSRLGFAINDVLETSGNTALVLVSIILFVKPLSVLLKQIGLLRTIVGLRRQLGVAALYFALFHFLSYTTFVSGSIIEIFLNAILDKTLQFGAISLLVIVILGATSNTFATRKLKRNWKRLHTLSYILLPLILLHVAFVKGDFEDTVNGIVLFSTYCLLQIAAYRKHKERRGDPTLSPRQRSDHITKSPIAQKEERLAALFHFS